MHQLENGSDPSKLDVGSKGHESLLAKQRHMEKFKDALKISSDHEFGSAFDLDL